MQDHAFTARTEAVDSTPAPSFFAGCSASPSHRAFTDAQRGSNLLGLWRLQKVLEVTVLREDIVERLVHNIVGGCVDESGVLIDLLGGGLIQPNEALM
jgi:hypothetical protein